MSADWLNQLAPGHAPAAVGWWPPAPGWWILGVLAVATLAALGWWLRQPGRGLRRAALRQLQIIRASDADGAAVARATQNLIRRYALAVFGRERVAKLTGERWLEFVIAAGGDSLAGAPGRSLLSAAFGNHAQDDREQWLAGAEGFIKRARSTAPISSNAPMSSTAHTSTTERAARESPAGRKSSAGARAPSGARR